MRSDTPGRAIGSATGDAAAGSADPSVSGRYYGAHIGNVGRMELDLRVDVEPTADGSPSMRRVSGDLFEVATFGLPGAPSQSTRTYVASWVVDAPVVTRAVGQVSMDGSVHFYRGSHPSTDVKIIIPWGVASLGPAEVVFSEAGEVTQRYTCPRRSALLRNVNFEIDVCDSVNFAPILPVYETQWHDNRPGDFRDRRLTIESSYADAGVGVTIRNERTIIDDHSPTFTSWTPSELHEAMETFFSQMGEGWPKWELWGIVAGLYEDSAVGGLMFDAPAEFGGAGGASTRQGFAVFRGHEWFNELKEGAPQTPAQAEAARKHLYTFVHEAGHAFNFLHSWNKARPNALSWMNYDWKYDQMNGVDTFWSRFRFRFDDEELIHLRHGDRSAVIMGGDAWASGGHLESPGQAAMSTDGTPPLEVTLRAQSYFDLLEPVSVEIRLRNLLTIPVGVDAQLDPSHGGVVVFVRGPRGQVELYEPVMCKLTQPRALTLSPTGMTDGSDRFSVRIPIAYGRRGFYFQEPGEYQIRAVYRGPGNVSLPSNLLRLRVGSPASKEEDRTAQDFFSHAVGMSLCLDGSESESLAQGMDVLRDVAERFPDTPAAATAAATVAAAVGRSFHGFVRPARVHAARAKLELKHAPDPRQARALTDAAINMFEASSAREHNLAHRALGVQRASYLVAMGNSSEASAELAQLRQQLGQRGVKPAILDGLAQADAALVSGEATTVPMVVLEAQLAPARVRLGPGWEPEPTKG